MASASWYGHMATVDGPDWYVAGELAFLGVNSLEDVQDNDEEAVIRTVCEAKRTRMGSVISHWRLAHHGITGMMSYILNLKRIRLQYQGRCRRRNCFKGLIRAIIVLHRMRLRAAQMVYVPGGAGFVAAAVSFKLAATSVALIDE